MKTVCRYLKPYLGRMSFGFVIKFVGTIADLMIPWILSYILDDVVGMESRKMILLWGGIMIVCALIAASFNIWANRLASSVSRDTTRALRYDLFRRVSYLSNHQVDDYSIPSLESRLTSDTYNVSQMLDVMQRMGVRAPLLLLGGITITLLYEPVLALVMISVIPMITLTVWMISRKGIPMYAHVQKGVDKMVQTVRENITGIRVIKALSRTEREKERFAAVNQDVVNRETKAAITMGITNPLMNFLLNFGMVLVIIAGAVRVNTGHTSPGAIIAFLSYFTIILNAMMAVTKIFVIYSKASASAQRISEVLETPADLLVDNSAKGRNKNRTEEGHIVFDDVSFSYLGSAENLSHISFSIRKGETLGIIGATGSGKSTIINLLMRMYEKTSGSIRISGKEITTIPEEKLHTKFGVVFQNDVLFADTIYGNIDFGRNLPREDIMKAARCAQAEEFINSLPEGYEHPVTSKGTNLSGGQKQRVLLARALAGNSEILILDDSSSALDYRTDSLLRQALRKEYAGVTSVIIAQRVSSILHADHILVLDEGRAIGYGSHEELMKTCQVYREISESQMGGDFD